MALSMLKCHNFMIAGAIKTNLTSDISSVGASATDGFPGLKDKKFDLKCAIFGNPRWEYCSNRKIIKKFTVHKTSHVDRECALYHFRIPDVGGGGHGGNRGGNSGGYGGGNEEHDGFNNSSSYLIWKTSFTGLIIWWQFFAKDKSGVHLRRVLIFLYAAVTCIWHSQLFSAFAKSTINEILTAEETSVNNNRNNSVIAEAGDVSDAVWEVKGGKWRNFLLDYMNDEFVKGGDASRAKYGGKEYWKGVIGIGSKDSGNIFLSSMGWCKNFILRVMLPEGYPASVTGDYLEYSLWRMCQGIASQMNGVLTTQALLYAVGLGKGAIPTAAAVNWVLKDGIGYLSKILLSKYGRHFDVHPKGWRLFADVLENMACGMELLTPAFPHFFVYLGAVAGAGRSAAGLIQAATRSCFYAGFAAQRNFAEVIAKGEAQGMVSKSLGIMFGIALSNFAGSSGPLLMASFVVVTGIHMFCNLKSYQAVQLRTLNPYRASLIFSEYLGNGRIPFVKDVNDEEPIFAGVPLFTAQLKSCLVSNQVISAETKKAAEEIDAKLQLGSKFSDVIHSKGEADALFDLYQNENYLLAETSGKFHVMLRSGASPQDMLRAMFQVCQLHWLERHLDIKSRNIINDCRPGGKLSGSLAHMQREFDIVQQNATKAGWLPDGLVARPLPFRLHLNNTLPSQ